MKFMKPVTTTPKAHSPSTVILSEAPAQPKDLGKSNIGEQDPSAVAQDDRA